MQIRQESEIDCEQIKQALQNINQRLNQLQKQIPHDVTIQKDPVIPKLNLNKLIKKNVQQKEQQFNQKLQYLPQQIQHNVPQKIRCQSLNNKHPILVENYKTQQYLLKQSLDQNKYQISTNKLSLGSIQQINKENYQIQQNIISQQITNQIIKNPTSIKNNINNNNFISQPTHPSSYVKIIQYYEMVDGTQQTIHKNSRSQSFHNIEKK